MFITKLRYCFVGLILMVVIQGCGKSDDSKAASEGAGVQVAPQGSTPIPKTQFSATISGADLIGSWVAGTGQATIEQLADGSFRMTNESKMVASGKIVDDILEAKDWKVTGRLSLDKKSLMWSSGFIWQR